jgi:hypothetical protein
LQMRILAQEVAVLEGLFRKFPKQTIREIFLKNGENQSG